MNTLPSSGSDAVAPGKPRRRRPLTILTPLALSRAMNTLLERAYWPQSLQVQTEYLRRHDDTDGEVDGSQDLSVVFGPDADAWISAGLGKSLRFRMPFFGGGGSPRVRNAMLILAEAIRRDNEEYPQAR